MAVKEIKEFLRQAYKLDRRIRITLGKAEKLRGVLEYSPPSSEGSGGGSAADRVPDTISKIIEYEAKADELKAKYVEVFLEIEQVINSIRDPVEREVLERRYLLYQKWEKIAEEMNFTERHIYRLHGSALQKLKMSLNVSI